MIHRRHVIIGASATLMMTTLCSCARLEVREATGPGDEGFHYFMPKYYLQATRSGPKVPGAPSAPLYDIQVVTFPDPAQRRTIVHRPGFGDAHASGSLADGWRLTQFGIETSGPDLSSFVTAATGAAKLVLPQLAGIRAETASRPTRDSEAPEEPITILLGIDMRRDRTQLFDEAILVYRDGSTRILRSEELAAGRSTRSPP